MTALLMTAWWLAPLAGALAISALLEAPRWFGGSTRWTKFRPTMHVVCWTAVVIHSLWTDAPLESAWSWSRLAVIVGLSFAAAPVLRDALLGIVVRANPELDVGVTVTSGDFAGRVTQFGIAALWLGTTRVPYRRLVEDVVTITAASGRGHVHEFEVTSTDEGDVESERRALTVLASLSPLSDPRAGVEVWYVGGAPGETQRFRIRGVVATREDGERWASDVRVRLRARPEASESAAPSLAVSRPTGSPPETST